MIGSLAGWVYWAICAFLAVTVAAELWDERDFPKQVTAALVLVPLVLRVLMWK